MTKKNLKGIALKTSTFALAGLMAVSTFVVASQMSSFNASAETEGALYSSDYDSKHEAIMAGYELNLRVAEEGMVLLKNENKALPIPTVKGLNATRVTVFGYAGAKPSGGSSGNGGDTSGGIVGNAGSVYSTLEAVGYKVNPYVKSFYNTQVGLGKTSDYQIKDAYAQEKDKLSDSYTAYSDAAFIVLTMGDTTATGEDAIDYNLQFNKCQLDLIDEVIASGVFDKVVVLINKSYPVELDTIKNNPGVDAILLVGETGTNGLVSAGPIICGDVNPSGRLSDSYPVDLSKDPSYVNFPNRAGGLGKYVDADGKDVSLSTAGAGQSGFTDYEEGIYVGYRYWETRGADEGAEWYNDNVSYTFGYGMSYTTFSWEVTPRKAAGSEITEKDVLKFDVKVTNTGDYAGKEVVQLYLNAPYYTGEIEKAENVLEDFAKTDTLAPGESQVVTLSVKVSDLASYDWNDANGNGIRGYELDNGAYNLRIATSSHYDAGNGKDTQVTYNVNGTDGTNGRKSIYVDKSETGYTIENQFEDMNAYASGFSATLTDKDGKAYSTYKMFDNDKGFDKALSRADWTGTFPTAPQNLKTTLEELKEVRTLGHTDNETDPWYVAEEDMPEYMTEEERAAAIADGKTQGDVLLTDLMGKSYDDPLWDKLLDQLTLLEMQDLVNYAGWQTLEIPYIGKPASRDTDGPKGWTGSNIAGEAGNMFCSEPVIAATFNVDLIYEIGKNVGDQGLWGSSDRTDGGLQEAYTCWYAPGMNIHRGAFDSRFIEYYSEDPVLTGKAAAAISLGLKEKGAYMTMKHFALHNDGSTVRASFFGTGYDGLSAWVNEQALREVYLRGYEICVEEGDAISAMSSFTRFGNTWAGASYSLCTEIYRNEWGAKGYIVTDIVLTDFQDGNQALRAGNDCLLTATFIGDIGMVKLVDEEGNLLPAEERNCELNATQVTAMRNAAKHMLWAVVNSNAMQAPMGAEVRYAATEAGLGAVSGTAVEIDLATATLGTRNEYGTISYAVTDGALPAGVKLSADGKLTGTPTTAGVYTFTVTASADSYISDSVTYTITVTAPEKAPDYSEITGSVDNATGTITGDIGDLQAAIDKNASDIAGVQTAVIVSVVVATVVILAAGAVVVIILKKKN